MPELAILHFNAAFGSSAPIQFLQLQVGGANNQPLIQIG